MIEFLTEKGIGNAKVNYKLRDWVFSRQRYWGEPIPIVHCDKCGYVPVDESELPLLLPEVESYMPTDNGESPLAAMTDWVNTTCPCCGGPAKRETDTMPQWAGSSWYFLRYTDPHNTETLASQEALKYWLPVDWYNGGMEHTTLHLLYSRFWHRFLYDQKVVPCPEPYQKRTSHGMILGENGEKMSKSRGNVVNPDDIVRDYGADTLRTYEMFIGAFDAVALEFQQKMLRFGKIVNLTMSSCFLPGYALTATEHTVNLAISQSGENRDVVESLKLLKKNKRYCIGITATPDSSVAKMCQEVILVDIQEQYSYEEKIDTFAVYSAFHFILDCMFSFLYQLDYESNEKETKEKAYFIKESKEQ